MGRVFCSLKNCFLYWAVNVHFILTALICIFLQNIRFTLELFVALSDFLYSMYLMPAMGW